MLYHALLFLVVGVIAAILGAAGVATIASQIVWVPLVIGIVLFILHAVAGRRRPAL